MLSIRANRTVVNAVWIPDIFKMFLLPSVQSSSPKKLKPRMTEAKRRQKNVNRKKRYVDEVTGLSLQVTHSKNCFFFKINNVNLLICHRT